MNSVQNRGGGNRRRGGRVPRRGFTLVELLVVIGIIGILVALIFPAIQKARRAADRHKAEIEAHSLCTALLTYQSEYNKWPITDPEEKNGSCLKLISILTAAPGDTFADTLNPRHRVFLKLSGISTNSAGDMVDPWDVKYKINLDHSFDNVMGVDEPEKSKYGLTTGIVGLAGVWSYGPNGVINSTNDVDYDDIKSW